MGSTCAGDDDYYDSTTTITSWEGGEAEDQLRRWKHIWDATRSRPVLPPCGEAMSISADAHGVPEMWRHCGAQALTTCRVCDTPLCHRHTERCLHRLRGGAVCGVDVCRHDVCRQHTTRFGYSRHENYTDDALDAASSGDYYYDPDAPQAGVPQTNASHVDHSARRHVDNA